MGYGEYIPHSGEKCPMLETGSQFPKNLKGRKKA